MSFSSGTLIIIKIVKRKRFSASVVEFVVPSNSSLRLVLLLLLVLLFCFLLSYVTDFNVKRNLHATTTWDVSSIIRPHRIDGMVAIWEKNMHGATNGGGGLIVEPLLGPVIHGGPIALSTLRLLQQLLFLLLLDINLFSPSDSPKRAKKKSWSFIHKQCRTVIYTAAAEAYLATGSYYN